MTFKLTAPFIPMGDQPEAISQLVTGVQKGMRNQVLLGATGTGKSLGYHENLFIVEEQGENKAARLVEIGHYIDALFDSHPLSASRSGESEILDASRTGLSLQAVSFHPQDGKVSLSRVTAFTRHRAPAQMYCLKTACGRSVVMTGDHNLWVLRDGELKLIETTEAGKGDFVVVPEKLNATSAIRELDTLQALKGERLFVEVPEFIRDYVTEYGNEKLYGVFRKHGMTAPAEKLTAIRNPTRGKGIKVDVFLDLLESNGQFDGQGHAASATIGGKKRADRLPASLEMTEEFLQLTGYYLAEENSQRGYFFLANREPSIRSQIENSLAQLGIPYFVRNSSDFQVSSTALTRLFKRLCGSTASKKKLPDFWTQLSDLDLAVLLRAYFDGAGTVGKSSDVSVTSASEQLASDLSYALLRFGIWARLSRRWKRATNSAHSGNWVQMVTISGQTDLQRFYDAIGFSLPAKQHRLEAQLNKPFNSNVDVVPINGQVVRDLRNATGWTAAELGARTNITPGAVEAIELGKRAPQRATLSRLLKALSEKASSMPLSWRVAWEGLSKLCHVRWTPVVSVDQVEYDHPYVYDLTVPGAETFLAGRGGLIVHNTFTIASVIQQLQMPALIMAHNKTLAAQLYAEFKDFFPENAVEYFVSYYDYYQPEAYVPRHDLYIEKETEINEEIERLRLAATMSLVSRKDVIIVASVSCIYGLGSPEEFGKGTVTLKVGEIYRRNALIRQLVESQYQRNDIELRSGRFRVRGDTLEVIPAYEDKRGFRITFFGDEVERIMQFSPLTGEIFDEPQEVSIYPAKQYLTDADRMKEAIGNIERELEERLAIYKEQGKFLEAQRIEQRTRYDLEMLKEVGYCSGVENYSRHLDGRAPGTHPWTMIDFLPSDYLLILDESHMTVPQIRGMYNGDRARKETLVEYGFRLPSAMDNRPLKFDEFEKVMGYTIYTSATPGPYELGKADQVAEQIIRPTGLIDPEVEVRPTKGQVDDLVKEIRLRVEKGERILVTTLTKRMSEDLATYLMELGMKVHYLHSEVETLERIGILRDLRLGVFDVIVGINLLREGLDLPEVSLVAILDADKEGFLRSGTALIQTIGRAARHINGRVIMYADRVTDSMKRALDETNRRRAKQRKYNEENHIIPVSIHKAIRDLTDQMSPRAVSDMRGEYKVKATEGMPKGEMKKIIDEIEKQMKEAAKNLEFEKAAALRDELYELKAIFADDEKLKPWERLKLLTGEDR